METNKIQITIVLCFNEYKNDLTPFIIRKSNFSRVFKKDSLKNFDLNMTLILTLG